jgi:NAD(P)H-flavin reductase
MSSGWSKSTLVENQFLAPGLHRVTLDVPQKISKAFHTPGQYHRVRVASGDDAFFAIASEPQATRFDYLVKESAGVAGEWLRLEPGAHVEVGMPEGPGFPLERARGSPLLLVGTGTGWGPLWSVVKALRQRRAEFGEVQALYGVDSEPHLAWNEQWPALAAEGVHIHGVLDRPGEAWKGRTGRVQHHVAPLARPGMLAFLCGHPAMVSDVTAILGQKGVPADRVFLNVPTL